MKKTFKIKISRTNAKLGAFIPCVNLPAGVTCRPDAPCQKLCYAKKGNFTYNNVRQSHIDNLELYKSDPETYFNDIIDYLNNQDVTFKYFRWHSSGDIVDAAYFEGMIKVAEHCENTRFLCFTKRFDIINDYKKKGGIIPLNLKIVFSGWTKHFKIDNPYNLPTTIIDFRKKEENAKCVATAIPCGGDCSSCKTCWFLRNGETVVFKQH